MRKVSDITRATADVGGMGPEQLEALEAYEAFTDAMARNDCAAMDALMEPSACCRRAGGRMQPREDWFVEIEGGSMRYHSADIVEVAITLDGNWAVVDPVVKIDAGIWDMSKIWTLSITTHMRRIDSKWLYSEKARYLAQGE